MPRRKLSRPLADHERALPSELRWDAPPRERSPLVLLSRREFLKATGVVLAALAVPFTRVQRAAAAARGRFFTRREMVTLEALCDRIVPPDVGPDGRPSPGGKALGVAVYVERLLTAFDAPRPRIFAGGPFSNRNPFPDNDTGRPSHRRPRNGFKRFVPLTRLQELRWRAELFGSDQVAGAAFNDVALGPLKGLRQVYRDGLAKVDEVARAMAGNDFAKLASADQDTVLGLLDRGVFAADPRRGDYTFVDILIQHTFEGCFAPPEYDGNRRLGGWRMIGLEGDDQPLGYSIFSRAADGYVERADHPVSTPNPDEVAADGTLAPRPITADSDALQRLIATLANFGSSL